MDDLTAQKVNKWLFWLMITFFIGVTYLNFRVLFHGIARMLWMLPFWLLLTLVVLMILLIIYLINKGEREINELETSLSDHQIKLLEMERKIRLVRQDLNQISNVGFKYYCADLLRTLDYQEVKVILNQDMIDIEATQENGTLVYVKCALASGEILRHQMHKLHYKMLQDGIKKGIVLTNNEFSEEEQHWASTFKIEYLNGEKLIGIVESLLEYSN